ncbi:MAG: glutamate synthase, partial [Deltaproteobacteria bacterium]|nr:glutamate synthase [Deltaproteobacteria bacterium]
MNRRWNITKGFLPSEYDGCAIICYCNKVGRPTHGNLQRTIEALVKMGHRAGEINGEGDGCGVLTDIPRLLWREALEEAGRPGDLAESASFALAHLLVPREALTTDHSVKEDLLRRFTDHGLEILTQRPGPVRSEALSANARRSEPFFWQIALRCPDPKRAPVLLASLAVAIERETPVHVASLSGHVAAYKVHGAPEILPHYYPELRRRDFLSALTIGHSRYSTNTLPTVLRAQPFGLLAHNGEINTIERLRDEARMMGVDLPQGGSDSQDLNRLLEGLMFRHGFSLFAAMEMVFPPIFSEMDRMPAELRNMYGLFRRLLSASAQGPAAVIARSADRCVFSVDALGLRPLWFGETEEEIFASSELGVVPHSEILSDPRPLSPGEKVGIRILPGKQLQIYDHGELIADVLNTVATRTDLAAHGRELFRGAELPVAPEEISAPFRRTAGLHQENLLAANAWKTSDLATLRQSAEKRREPITSLG